MTKDTYRRIGEGALILLILLFSFGFARAIYLSGREPVDTDEAPVFESEGINLSDGNVILLLGDSIGDGVGDEENLGIGLRYKALLPVEETTNLTVENYAVSGSETRGMVQGLESGERDLLISDASLIIISIGGNNLNRINEDDPSLELAAYEETLASHLTDLDKALSYIRGINSEVPIVHLELYNPYEDQASAQDVELVLRWNYESRLRLIEYDNTRTIPLYDKFQGNLDKLLTFDRFHPSGAGYQLIAESVYQVLGPQSNQGE